MKVGSIFVKFISSLLVLIFGLLCLTTTIFILAKNMTSHDNISRYIQNTNIFDYPIRDIISDEKGETLRQTIKKDLLEFDIPALVVDEVIDSNEIYQIVSDYVYGYSRYILYNENKPVFSTEKILEIAKEKYTKQERKQLSNKQISELSQYLNQLGEKVDQDTFNTDEINEMLSINIIRKIANIFDSKYMVVTLVLIVTIIFAIISICLSSIKKAINWCGKMTVFDGILLIIASFVEVRVLIMYFNSQGLLDSLAISIIENGFKNMLTYGVVLIVIGLIFVIISGILLKKEKKANSHKKYNFEPIPTQETEYKEEETEPEEKEEVKEEQKPEPVPEKPEETKEEIKEEPKEEKQEETKNEEPKDNPEPEKKEEPEVKEEPKLEDKKPEQKEEKVKQPEPKEEVKIEPIEEITIVPVSEEEQEEIDERELEETKEIEIEDTQDEEPEEQEESNEGEEYTEINDEPEQKEEPIVKEDIKVSPLETVSINLIHPEKGRDIEFNPEEKSKPKPQEEKPIIEKEPVVEEETKPEVQEEEDIEVL